MRSDLFLVDSSVWIDVYQVGVRGMSDLSKRVDGLIAADAVVTIGMVRLELLRGADSPSDWDRLEEILSGFHAVETKEEQWTKAARLGVQLQRRGVTVPSQDLLIASTAMEFDVTLVHRDRHFDLIAAHVPLRVESYV